MIAIPDRAYSPFRVKSGRREVSDPCLLYPRKRTSSGWAAMSALCQKRASEPLHDHHTSGYPPICLCGGFQRPLTPPTMRKTIREASNEDRCVDRRRCQYCSDSRVLAARLGANSARRARCRRASMPVPDTVSPQMQKIIGAPITPTWNVFPKTAEEWKAQVNAGRGRREAAAGVARSVRASRSSR